MAFGKFSEDYKRWNKYGKTDDEIAFEKFVSSGYDANGVPVDDIPKVTNEWRLRLVPYFDVPTWQQQEERRRQWPWVFALFVGRMYGNLCLALQENKAIKAQLIDARKEITRLKRNK